MHSAHLGMLRDGPYLIQRYSCAVYDYVEKKVLLEAKSKRKLGATTLFVK